MRSIVLASFLLFTVFCRLLSFEHVASAVSQPTKRETSTSIANSPVVGQTTPTVISVIAVVPTIDEMDYNETVEQWKRGEEILPGAMVALEEITAETENRNESLQLNIIPVRIPLCDTNDGIVSFVRQLASNRNSLFGVIGYFCQNVAQRFSQLLTHEELRMVQISAIPPPKDILQPVQDQYSILPTPEANSKAVIALLQRLTWTHIAVISNSDLNYKTAKENFVELAQQYRINVSLQVEVPRVTKQTAEYFLQELLNFGVKIIVTFVPPSEAMELICSAYISNFSWPNYSWIIMDNDNVIFSEILAKKDKLCTHSPDEQLLSLALSNTIFIRAHLKNLEVETRLNHGTFYKAYIEQLETVATKLNVSIQSNPYASTLYDAVWAFAVTLNRSQSVLRKKNISLMDTSRRGEIIDVLEDQMSQLTLQGVTGFLNFSQKTATLVSYVELLQFQNGHSQRIGIYDSHVDHLTTNLTIQDTIPNIMLDQIYVLYPVSLTVLLTIVILLLIALTTISMCLFFYYRKQPAIKATSSTLSICMFIGCYFLFTSSLFHTINSGISKHDVNEHLRAFVCMFDTYLINIGFDTVFATVIAKTLRVYHIFNKFGKVGRICSDQGLLVLILTAVFVKISLLILWTCLDVNHLVDEEHYVAQSVPPYWLVRQQCEANYLNIWIAFLSGYSLVLLVTLVVLAFMTRNIKRKHFNESKKISTLSGVLVCFFSITWALWILLRLIDASILSKVVYSLGTMLTALFCQVFLILPKVVPLVLHKKRRHVLVSLSSQLTLTSFRQFSRTQFTTEDTLI